MSDSTADSAWPALQRAAAYIGHALDVVAPMLPQFSLLTRSPRQAVVDGLTVHCHRIVPDSPRFEADCEQLYLSSVDATPFHSLAWQRALLETAQARGRLRLFTVYDSQRLIGVFPLEERRGKILSSTGGIMADYLDPLIDPAYGQRCWDALLTALKTLAPGRSVSIAGLREECAALKQVEHARVRAAGFDLRTEADRTVLRIPLPATWDDYLKSLDGHDRRELKRRLRKSEQEGAARLDICTEPQRVQQEMNVMFESMRGEGGGKSLKARWLFPRHFMQCAESLARSGRLAVFTLVVNGQPAARTIQLVTSQGLIGWNLTIEPAMREWSPGIVLIAMIIRHSIEKGYRTHDMSTGEYDYKQRLGARQHSLRTLTFRPAA